MHFSIMGPTGDGKTYLALALLELREHVLILDGKGVDDTLDGAAGYRTIQRFPSPWDLAAREKWRYRLRPRMANARRTFDEAFRRVWNSSGRRQRMLLDFMGRPSPQWTVYADETRLLSSGKFFRLEDHFIAVWISGRSRGISLLASVQAPRFIPSEFYDQPGWLALSKPREQRTVKRTAEITGQEDMAREVLPTLGEHEFLFVGPRGESFISKPVRKGG